HAWQRGNVGFGAETTPREVREYVPWFQRQDVRSTNRKRAVLGVLNREVHVLRAGAPPDATNSLAERHRAHRRLALRRIHVHAAAPHHATPTAPLTIRRYCAEVVSTDF